MSELPYWYESEGYGTCTEVRVETCGKSARAGWRQCGDVNSIRSNTVEGHMAGPAVPGRWLERIGNGAPR